MAGILWLTMITLILWYAGFHKWGYPESSIWIGFSLIDHPFWGTPIYGNHQSCSLNWSGRWCRPITGASLSDGNGLDRPLKWIEMAALTWKLPKMWMDGNFHFFGLFNSKPAILREDAMATLRSSMAGEQILGGTPWNSQEFETHRSYCWLGVCLAIYWYEIILFYYRYIHFYIYIHTYH